MSEAPKKRAPKKRAPKKVDVAPYASKTGRGFDIVDGVKKLDGGTALVTMRVALGCKNVALNPGEKALLPPSIAEAYVAKGFADPVK